MNLRHWLLLGILMPAMLRAQEPAPFKIYTADGKKTSWKKLVKKAAKADVVFFGEEHNNAVAHWLELRLAQDLYKAKDGKLILGAEMFERDNQEAVTRYVKGEIDEKTLDSLARLWPNFKRDYKPLLDFAREHGLPFIATNIPRRYASMVYKKGFESLDSLSAKEKEWIAPLPIAYDPELSQYKKMVEMMGGHGHGGENLPKAQAVKDATMAYFIARHLRPGYTFLHFNGSYHSAFDQGILWYLRRYKPDVKIVTVQTVSQEDISRLEDEHKGTADFIILVDDRFPKSY
ncbi:MAG: ChaN family lipoprotein [Chlorobi bacterium]|nr:ChaN family lipoprotein [Chlorobiota bacterium]